MDNYIYNTHQKSHKKWVYMLLLYVSFIWLSLYTVTMDATDSFRVGYGNLLDVDSVGFLDAVVLVIFEALFLFLEFEVVFYLYKFVISFKIYTFIVPPDELKYKAHIYFIYRNIIYGVFLNLCFLFPFLKIYSLFMDIVITLLMLIVYSKNLAREYAEPIVSHFVFKNFCFPVFVYEVLNILIMIMGVA